MCWKWGKSPRDRLEISARGALFDAPRTSHPIHRSQLLISTAGRCSFCPPPLPRPHVWERTSPGASWGAWTATGSRAPRRVYPEATAVDVPRGWRCPHTCLCSYNLPEAVWGVYRNNQSGMRAINLFDWGNFEAHLLSSYNFGLWLYSAGSMILLPLNFLVESRDGRFVWNPVFVQIL